MDPDNPGPDGARALARVLEDEGVDVQVARGADALEAIDVGRRHHRGGRLPELPRHEHHRAAARAHRQAHAADRASAPGPGVADALGELGGAERRSRSATGRDAGCDDPLFDGLTVEVDSGDRSTRTATASRRRGSARSSPSRADGLLLFGADQALTNDQILRADNAAVALRLLGQDERLVWYVPTLDDLVGDDGVSLQTLLPRWIRPGLWLARDRRWSPSILWRARRLGALATEPLPVVVRAVETTRSLGRLYRRAGDRGHAAAVAAPRPRGPGCAERLRLGSAAPTRRPGPRGGPAHRPHRDRGRRTARPARRPYRPPTAT